MRFHRFLSSALVGVVLGASAAAASAADLGRVTETGQLVVAVYENFPPFSFVDEDGKLKGIDVDVGKELAKRLDVKPVMRQQGADESVEDDLRNAVWKGHYIGGGVADVMLHIPVDPLFAARIDQVKFVAPYYREEIQVAFVTERFDGPVNLEAFETHLVGVETATLSDDFLLSTNGGSYINNVRHFATQTQAVAAMAAGEVDAVMGHAAELDALIDNYDGMQVSRIELFGLRRPWWDLGAAVKAENSPLGVELTRVMEEMSRDGTLDEIFAKHGVSRTPPTISAGPGMRAALTVRRTHRVATAAALGAAAVSHGGATAAEPFSPAPRMAITLHAADGRAVPMGTAAFTRAGDGWSYELTLEGADFSEHFLSMRPFRCVEGPAKMPCHLPYPYDKPSTVTASAFINLEYDLLFLFKSPTEYGINAWNGLYYRLEPTAAGRELRGTLHEVDLNVLAAPPDEPYPVGTNDLYDAAADHAYPTVTLTPLD